MPTFVMFGKYSGQALSEISADRTAWAYNLVKENGGTVKEIYALLGEKDLIFILDLPGIAEAVKVSATLSKNTGIALETSPAITVDEFDKLLA